jgi:hypothetical protein
MVLLEPKDRKFCSNLFCKSCDLQQDLPLHQGQDCQENATDKSSHRKAGDEILDRHVCFSRREELQDVLNLLKEEKDSMNGSKLPKDDKKL